MPDKSSASSERVDDQQYYSAWSVITVGVSDLSAALELWVHEFGMNVVASMEGDDPDLARLWDIQADDIVRQALLRTNDQTAGMLHLVEFNDPDEPVRKGANPFDLTPKNLDIYTEDLLTKLPELSARGYQFRHNEAALITSPDGSQFREVHMFGHDDVNIVLVEVVGKKKPFTNKGVAAVGPLVFIVPDVQAESDFFESLLLLDKLNENVFTDPELIKAIGLPQGAALNIHIWGRQGFDLGQLEIIEYQGVQGNNLYPRAKPKSLGVLHLSYVVPDSTLLQSRLNESEVGVSHHGAVDTIIGKGEVISFHSPAGLKIEIYSQHNLIM